MKSYKKLVRDNIPDIIRANGETPVTRVLEDDAEYLAALTAKLREEADEFAVTPTIEELADVEELVVTLRGVLGISAEELEAARHAKVEKNGGFEERIYLEAVVPQEPEA